MILPQSYTLVSIQLHCPQTAKRSEFAAELTTSPTNQLFYVLHLSWGHDHVWSPGKHPKVIHVSFSKSLTLKCQVNHLVLFILAPEILLHQSSPGPNHSF